MQPIEPDGWSAPRGYSNGMLAPPSARILFVAGQVGWDENQKLVEGGFVAQFEQALANVVRVVRTAGGEAGDLGRLTIYVTDRREYSSRLEGVGEIYRQIMGRHYPAMSLVEVQALLEPGAKVEIEATAVVPCVDESGEERRDGN